MNNKSPKNDLSTDVLEKIKSGQVKMKPRIAFVLKTTLFITGLIFAFLTIIFVISFVIFVIRGSGAWFLPSFGWRGIRTLFFALPWVMVALALICLVIIELLIKHFGFAYRRPLVYSIFGVALLVILGGVWVASTSLHPGAFNSAIESRLPLIGPLYRNYGSAPIKNMFNGTVISSEDEELQIETADGQNFNIEFLTSTDFMLIAEDKIEEGDAVLIVGEKHGLVIKAYGIRKFGKDEEPFFHKDIRNLRLKKQPLNPSAIPFHGPPSPAQD